MSTFVLSMAPNRATPVATSRSPGRSLPAGPCETAAPQPPFWLYMDIAAILCTEPSAALHRAITVKAELA
jgi:hypothetical protein